MNSKITEYILKHSKKHDKELKYDFMPSLLEIIERPAHIGGKVIIYGICTLIIGVVIWASISKVDVVVTASGSTKPVGDINTIQAYSAGTIKQIYVKNGQLVKKGDVLMELDSDTVEIAVNQIKTQTEALNTQLNLFQKILNGEDVTQISLEGYSDSLKSYVQSIIESERSYLNNLENLKLEKSNCNLEYQIAVIAKDKYESIKGYQSELEAQEIVVQQKQIAINQAEMKMNDASIQHNGKVVESISKITEQLNELNAQLEKANMAQEYQSITAPVEGYINNIGVNTIGGVVTSSQALLTIVPSQTVIEMECYVKNMDISDISVGDEAEIKLEAYSYSKYGTIPGKVTYISPSSFISEDLGSVYLVKIEINNVNENINVISGLTGSIEIKIDKRRVISYFLDPIIKGLDESLKEK